MMADPNSLEQPRRRALKLAVSALCADIGFTSADDACLETLTEMLQSFLTEAGNSSRAFSELSCRTNPMLSDVIIALIEMGFNVQSLLTFAKKANKIIILPPNMAPNVSQPKTLQAGEKKPRPSYIPDYLPQFPDPHTYTRTLTHKQPVTDYQVIREKAASQKRDVERALTRFIAKTGETENLFQDDPYAFPLIAHKPSPLPYLEALLSKDEEVVADEEDEKCTQTQNESPKRGEQKSVTEQSELNTSQESASKHSLDGTVKAGSDLDAENQIDNPYLRTIKMPKFKGGGKKYKW